MHIYAFGSITRGEIDIWSDIDLLALVDGYDDRFDITTFSVYNYERIAELWREGNPFAWHLSHEAKLVHTPDGTDFLATLGPPSAYRQKYRDCNKFFALFTRAKQELAPRSPTVVFDLSVVFVAIRNFASSFLLGRGTPDFSRNAALRLGNKSVPIRRNDYSTFERARLLCTRGAGERLTASEIESAIEAAPAIEAWMLELLEEVENDE